MLWLCYVFMCKQNKKEKPMEDMKNLPPIVKIIGALTIVCLLFFKGIPVNISIKTEEDIGIAIKADARIPIDLSVKNDDCVLGFKVRH